MTPDELLKKLESMGIIVSRRTLLRYEENKLIPEPKRGSEGRGVGRFTDYHENTPYEFFASWYLMKKHKMDVLDTAKIRDIALNKVENFIHNPTYGKDEKKFLWQNICHWLDLVEKAKGITVEMMESAESERDRIRNLYVRGYTDLYKAEEYIKKLELENRQLKDQLKKFKNQ